MSDLNLDMEDLNTHRLTVVGGGSMQSNAGVRIGTVRTGAI